jgi:hypothetical protein
MKKLFAILFSTTLLFASCVKVEDMFVEDTKTTNDEIVFNTRASVSTKAIVEGTAMVDTMGVYAYVVPGSYSQGGYLMKNAKYNKDGNAAGDKVYYWPKSDNNEGVDFIFTAYSQYVNAPTWENDTLKLAVPALTQALIDNPGDFNDVLWAQTAYDHHQDGNVGEEHERVDLNFKHALSWLQFKGEVTNANIKWVKVKSIRFGAHFDGSPAVYENDTTDTWVNLKRSYSAVGSGTKLKGPGEST